MNTRYWNVLARLSLLSSLLLGVAVSPTPAQDSQERNDEKAVKIEGTWFVQVTVRNCVSGIALRTFPAINTFNGGHTEVDTTTGFSPSQRSPGLGNWERTGSQTYSATVLAFLFDATGAWTGTQRLRHSIEVKGDESLFTTAVQFFDTKGTPLSAGCATAVGHRL
jgi:hypothetical protein